MIGAEVHLPYQRPPLSKACFKGELDTQSLHLKRQATYDKANIEFILNTRVLRVDRQTRTILLADHREVSYEKLALTTGGHARKLAIEDAERAGWAEKFHHLRTIDDVEKIRSSFPDGRSVVIIGGSFIGLEVAASAVQRGLRITVLEGLPRVLAAHQHCVRPVLFVEILLTRGSRIPEETPLGLSDIRGDAGNR